MPSVAIRVLIINREIKFVTKLKRALEQTGHFEVSPFTSAETALDYLRGKSQHVALVDFTIRDMLGIDVVLELRRIQPDIAIIASPNEPDVIQVANDLALQGIVDFPIGARRLIPAIEQAINEVLDNLPETTEAPTLRDDSDTMRIETPHPTITPEAGLPPKFSSLDSVLVHVGGLSADVGTETLDVEMDSAGYAIPSETTSQDSRSVEFVLRGDLAELQAGTPRTDDPPLDDESVNLLQQLAAEEPPMPSLEESGTVGDLRIGVGDTNLREVVEILQRNQPIPDFVEQESDKTDESDDEDKTGNTARMILSKALDSTTPLDVNLDDLLNDIDSGTFSDSAKVRARFHGQDMERYVREPDFLPEESQELEQSAIDVPMPVQREEDDPVDMPLPVEHDDSSEADLLDTDDESTGYHTAPPPPPGLPERPPLPAKPIADEESLPVESESLTIDDMPLPISETGEIDAEEVVEFQTGFGTQPIVSESMPVDESQDDEQPIDVEADESADVQTTESVSEIESDVDITGLALNLTQASVDSTADATVLARNGEIIDFAGTLAPADIDDLSEEIDHDWEAEPEEARIRFITLESSGADYMLYSRRTEDDYTLSLVFTGNMPLRTVRRQYDDLVEALYTVPEVVEDDAEIAQLTEQLGVIEAENTAQMEAVSADDIAETEIVVALTVYTIVWLVRDPNMVLAGDVVQGLLTQLDEQMTKRGWDVMLFQVHEDFVYLMAGVPDELMAYEMIDELKIRSADIVHTINPDIVADDLWADGYLAFVPGRELDVAEIQRFINFSRVRD